MTKTTVYLNEEEAAALRKLAAETGLPQAHLIREGLRQVLGLRQPRRFSSMGKGASTGRKPRRWAGDEVYGKVTGRRT
ncbi:MAG: hypothetical protein NVSMB57_06700 [Actinomycetota bacterium]